jgi:putative transposase
VIEYIQFHKDRRDENGQRLVVRNGHLPERELVSGVGPIPVRQPRVHHRDKGHFTSAILPKYMRRAPSIDALLPALYLKVISTGDFSEALTAILGEGASGLTRKPTTRLLVHCIGACGPRPCDKQPVRARDPKTSAKGKPIELLG